MNKLNTYLPYILPLFFSLVVFYKGSKVLVNTDAQRYAILANNLSQGKGYTLMGFPELVFPPGFSLLLTPFLAIGVNLSNSVSLLMALSYFFLGIFVYLISRKYFNKTVSIILTIVILVNGQIMYWTILGSAEIVMWTLIFGSYYFFNYKSKNRLLYSGVLAGFAYLVKPEALGYIFFGSIVVFLINRKITKDLLKVWIVLILFVFSYSVFLYMNSGDIALTGKSATLNWDSYIENPSNARESIVYQLNEDGSVGQDLRYSNYSFANLKDRILINLNSLKISLFEILLPFKITLIAFAGVILLSKKARKIVLLACLLLAPEVSVLLFHIEHRYLLPLLLFVLANFVIGPSDWRKGQISKLAAALSLIALVLITYYSYLPIRAEYGKLNEEKTKHSNFVEKADLEGNIIARKPVYSFLAEKDYYPLPWVKGKEELNKYFEGKKNYTVIIDNWSKATLSTTHKLILENEVNNINYIEYEE